MLNGFLFCHAVDRSKFFVTDIGGIRLECIQVRHVPLDEELQQPPVHELVWIGHDGREELFILLIASQLSLAILGSGDDDRIKV